jgi:hypothetical protein
MMVKVLARSSWLSLLGLVLAALSAGCEDANEAKFKSEGPAGVGVADPKYAQDTPATYQQYSKDLSLQVQKKGSSAKEKPAPAKGTAAEAPAPEASQPQPAPESEKKP